MSKREEAREKLMRRAAKEISNEETLKDALSFIVEEFNKKDGNDKPTPARDIVKAYEKKYHEAAAPTTNDIVADFLKKEAKRQEANKQAKARREAKKAPTEEEQTNE